MALGGLIQFGGGSSSSGGGGSGIQSLNNQHGPSVVITGSNGAIITAGGNVINIDLASLSGFISQNTGSGIKEINDQTGPNIQVSGINGIIVNQPRSNFILVDYIPLSGIFDINGLVGPSVSVTGINGISVYPTGGLLTVDGFGLIPTSGIFLINNQLGPYIIVDGVNGASIITGTNKLTVDVSSLSGLIQTFTGSGITRINDQTGPEVQISGINGIVVTQPRPNFILLDAASISGTGSSTPSGNACYTTTFVNVLEQTFTHALGTKAIIVQIQDTNDEFIMADRIVAVDINNVLVRFNELQSGRLTVVSCGDISVSPSGVTKYAAAFLNITSGIFAHGLNTRDVVVNLWDNSGPPRKFMADDVILDDLDHLSLIFNQVATGRIVVIG